jgi:predicted secreted protein
LVEENPGAGSVLPAPEFAVREFADPDVVDVQIGERFAVVMSDNGPGGYLWQLRDPSPGIRLRCENDLAPGEGAPGATGERVFELEAVDPGTHRLRFERCRDWEPGADREHTVVVNVQSS